MKEFDMTGDPTSAAGVAFIVKYYGWKVIGGVIAVSLGFLVLWPKTAQEGVSRIAATILGSVLFGEALVSIIAHYVKWFPTSTVENKMLIYVLAGLPAWWILGACVRWLDSRKNKDIAELVNEVRGK
jgi:hypothetical protein